MFDHVNNLGFLVYIDILFIKERLLLSSFYDQWFWNVDKIIWIEPMIPSQTHTKNLTLEHDNISSILLSTRKPRSWPRLSGNQQQLFFFTLDLGVKSLGTCWNPQIPYLIAFNSWGTILSGTANPSRKSKFRFEVTPETILRKLANRWFCCGNPKVWTNDRKMKSRRMILKFILETFGNTLKTENFLGYIFRKFSLARARELPKSFPCADLKVL